MLKRQCGECHSENTQEDPNKRSERIGNWWIEYYVCVDCGYKFIIQEEIKHRGN